MVVCGSHNPLMCGWGGGIRLRRFSSPCMATVEYTALVAWLYIAGTSYRTDPIDATLAVIATTCMWTMCAYTHTHTDSIWYAYTTHMYTYSDMHT